MDVGSAVSAVISTFQSARDLVVDSKKKKHLGWRKKSSSAVGREKHIQDALQSAAEQIRQAYQSGGTHDGKISCHKLYELELTSRNRSCPTTANDHMCFNTDRSGAETTVYQGS
jgi:hypothetical protein